jgi:Protein of unknown function C-terminus (DUF2399)
METELAALLTTAEWDPELAPAMQAIGAGVQEESALELLLADLEPAAAGRNSPSPSS